MPPIDESEQSEKSRSTTDAEVAALEDAVARMTPGLRDRGERAAATSTPRPADPPWSSTACRRARRTRTSTPMA